MKVLFLILAACLVSCQTEEQTIQSSISFKLDGHQFEHTWSNFTSGSSQIVAEASDSFRIFALTINKSHHYDNSKVELTTNSSKSFRAVKSEFFITSKNEGDLYTAEFNGKMASGSDTIIISEGFIQYE